MMDLSTLNPGIRETVRWLRQNEFDTCDSGDGETRDHECDLDRPYVHIEVGPSQLIAEMRRLGFLLEQVGVKVGPMNEENTAPCLDGSWHYPEEAAFITLWNVKLTAQ